MAEIRIYNLRIVPPTPVYERVVAFKKQFIDAFGPLQYSKSKPHVTLVQFEMDVDYEPLLIKYFSALSDMETFKMTIEGVAAFEKGSKVLLLKMSPSKNFEQLLAQIKVIWRRDLHRGLTALKVSNTPHITISKTKDVTTLHKSLELFKDIAYFKEFEVNELVLLSRPHGKTWDWECHIPLS